MCIYTTFSPGTLSFSFALLNFHLENNIISCICAMILLGIKISGYNNLSFLFCLEGRNRKKMCIKNRKRKTFFYSVIFRWGGIIIKITINHKVHEVGMENYLYRSMLTMAKRFLNSNGFISINFYGFERNFFSSFLSVSFCFNLFFLRRQEVWDEKAQFLCVKRWKNNFDGRFFAVLTFNWNTFFIKNFYYCKFKF